MNKAVPLIALVIIVGVIYFVFFGSGVNDFDSGLTQINSFWEKQSLSPNDLASPLKVYATDQSKLIALQSDLTQFSKSIEGKNFDGQETLMLLTETELDLVNSAIQQKKNSELTAFFDSREYNFDALCSSMDKAEQLSAGFESQKNLAQSFNAKTKEFIASFPEEAQKAGISGIELKVNSDSSINELKGILDSLKVVC